MRSQKQQTKLPKQRVTLLGVFHFCKQTTSPSVLFFFLSWLFTESQKRKIFFEIYIFNQGANLSVQGKFALIKLKPLRNFFLDNYFSVTEFSNDRIFRNILKFWKLQKFVKSSLSVYSLKPIDFSALKWFSLVSIQHFLQKVDKVKQNFFP